MSGLVQGVSFRQSTVEAARELGIDGWVRNCPDGRVEGIACGEAEALQQLRAWLAHGPMMARVEAVEWTAHDGPPPPAGFRIHRLR